MSPSSRLTRRIEFEANYFDDSAMFFVEVQIATRDDEEIKNKLIKFILGSKKPYRTTGYEEIEYTAEIKPPSLGNGWSEITISLPDEVDRTWGQDGWYYQGLRAIRVRGKLGLSPIRLY